MFSDGFSIYKWEKAKMDELVKDTERDLIRDEALQLGMERGMERGIHQNIINTIKSMISERCSFDLISKVTGKSLDEIKNIEKSMI